MITLRNVHKSFGEKQVFRGVDLEVEAGETHVIIGRSGEGKSVLLKIISGLMNADSGELWVDGQKLDSTNRQSLEFVRERLTMVFQMGALFDSLTVRENVGFYPDSKKKMNKRQIDELCEKLLDEVNLPNTGHLLPAELSGGMRKRVGLARALAVRPKIILYDEPTTGLDPVTTEVIGDLMMRTNRRHNMTAVVVTHDMKSAYKIADRISMLYEGQIIYTGTPDRIRNCEQPVVCQFVNGSARGPITQTESEDVSRLSNEMIDRSLAVRRIKMDEHD